MHTPRPSGLSQMTGIIAVLSVNIVERARLSEIFGEVSTRQAMADFGEAVDGLLTRLLAQHAVIDRYGSAADGRWAACFHVPWNGLPRDAREVAEAIEHAGRNLIREPLLASFGGGTGARINADLSVFLMSSETSERGAKACWIQWTEDQLRSQPRRQIAGSIRICQRKFGAVRGAFKGRCFTDVRPGQGWPKATRRAWP